MQTTEFYNSSSRMFDLICRQPELLQMMSRFGIPLGVEDKAVAQVCDAYGVDTLTFVAVANYISFGAEAARHFYDKVSVHSLIDYLRRAHEYFLEFQLPAIRRKLLEAIVCSNVSDVNPVVGLIVKFYDDYTEEVRRHMENENKEVFTYVADLLAGRRRSDYEIDRFARSHESINVKLQELKNIIIKYYKPDAASDLLNSMMYDIFECEKDLQRHCGVENHLFVPAVRLLEAEVADKDEAPDASGADADNCSQLTEREKEVVALAVRGFRNKEIADRLCISVHTVLTHRKNIGAKLDIHSLSGLTIYAIVNRIVTLDDLEAPV